MKYDNIKGYPGYYISKRGNLFTRWKRVGVKGKGGGRKGTKVVLGIEYKPKALKIRKDGYVQSSLGHSKFYIHRLVYSVYGGPIPNDMVIDHIDGNKQNNNIKNLRLVTQSENLKHNYRDLGYVVHNKYLNFSDEERRSILADYRTMSIKKLAIKYKYSRYFIHQVLLGKR